MHSGQVASAQEDVNILLQQNTNNAFLKYYKINNNDRFIFDFPEGSKISYSIRSDDKSTTIVFSRLFQLETSNLTNFEKYDQITQKKISARQMEITFPLPLASSIEHLNSVVLDLSPLSSSKDVKKKNITPLQISSLGFSWNTPVALSVFKREKYIWIVFNQYQKVDIAGLKKDAGSMVKDIIQLPHGSATILRLEAKDELYSEVRQEGLLWIIDLYNHKAERNLNPIGVITDDTIPGKPSIVVNLPHTEDIFSFLDPEVGDVLMAITSSESGHAFLNGYKYPDFEFLPSSQGMAINSDDFGISLIRNASGFILQTTGHPLNISQNIDKLKKDAALKKDESGVNLSQDLNVPIIRKNFADSEQYLRAQIESAPDEDKDKLKIELVRFYLSHALGSNAMGLLREIKTSYKGKGIPLTLQIHELTGVAAFLMKRYNMAFSIFSKPEFANDPEKSLWKILSETDDSEDNSALILRDLSYFHSYPEMIKRTLFLRALDYANRKQNEDLMQKLLTLVKELRADNDLIAAQNYYEAEKVRMQGYFKSALPLFLNAARSGSNYFSAMARFQIADFNSRVADAKQAPIILEFERLKYAWGERNFKIKVLNKLVELYLKTNDFHQALSTLQLISSLSSKQKSVVEQRMIQIMEELYYYNNDSQFNPIKALALFDDFGYLISRSPYQTAITIKLADRLVAVDLLDRAYNLLSRYLFENKNKLSHEEISAMGGRMALINMFKHDELSALQDLDRTRFSDIPETLAVQRKIIEAKAYVQLGNPQKALAMLKNNTSRNAILLKSEIYWNSGQWDKASDMLRLLVEKPEKDKPLTEEQIRFVLDWITALKQAKKETVIVRVRNTFLPYFEKTPYISLFNILTDHFEDDTISITDVDRTIQNVKAFSDFAKQYTQSLLSESIVKKDETKQQ